MCTCFFISVTNKLIVKQKFCASSWLITEINILRCTVSKTSKNVLVFTVFCIVCTMFFSCFLYVYLHNNNVANCIIYLAKNDEPEDGS